MFLDIIALGIILYASYKGLRKGLIVALFSFIAFVVGLAAALKLSALAAGYIGDAVSVSQKWLPVIAFILVFLVVVLLVKLGAGLVQRFAEALMLGWINRLGGAVFFILLYLFIFSILLFYAAQLHIIRPETEDSSIAFRWLSPLAPAIMEGIGRILPFFSNMFNELLQFFENVSDSRSKEMNAAILAVGNSSKSLF